MFFSCSNFWGPPPSTGDRRCDNAMSEARLCLCRTKPPSGARSGGNPLSPRHYFLIVFRINFYAKLSGMFWQIKCKKPKDRKVRLRAKRLAEPWERPTPLGYGNSLTTFRPKGSFGSEEVFCICPRTRQRAEAQKYNRKRLKTYIHKYYKGLDGHKHYGTMM